MITILIPAYNEVKIIAKTITSLKETLGAFPDLGEIEILVIDDGSDDGTEAEVEETGASVIRHPHNVGYGQALKTGIRAAKYDTIVIIDADLTYPVQAIPALVADYKNGFDMVVGARTGHYYAGGALKGPLRIVLKFLVEFAAGRKIPDANSGLRVFSKSTIGNYLSHLCDTFSFTTSLTLAYMMTGKFVKYIPIEYHERVGNSKVRLFKDSLLTLQYITQSIIYYSPLKIFLLLAGCLVIIAMLGFLLGAITGLGAPYYLGIGGLLMAIIIFCLGLLADLLKQIMAKTSTEK